MITPRWRGVLRDLLQHRGRTMLVVLSIAVGVFGFASIIGTRATILDEVSTLYVQTNPASAILTTDRPFDHELVDVVRGMPSVQTAEGRRTVQVRVQTGPTSWYDMRLTVIPDFDDIEVATISPLSGAWPPAKHEVLLERASLRVIPAQLGDNLNVELPDGTRHTLRFTGLVHDLNALPPPAATTAYGYITADTAETLSLVRNPNLLYIVVAERPSDEAHIWSVAAEVEKKIERSGRSVSNTEVPEPRQHPAEANLTSVLAILTVLGVLAVLLSGFLIVNTITAILAQQTRQIGVMKSIGAQTPQVMVLYLGMVAVFGVLALIFAVPLGVLGANGFAQVIGRQLNFDLPSLALPLWVFGLELAVGLLVPLITAFAPVRSTAQITVREAITDYGISADGLGHSPIDRALEHMRGLPRPLALSLRNTFRRKGRLLRTLAALALSGAIFMSVATVRSSLFNTLDNAHAAKRYDIQINLVKPERTELLDLEVRSVPGVQDVEFWGFESVFPKRPDGSTGERIQLYAPPANTVALEPVITQGRWLLPDESNALVVSSNFFLKQPGVAVGGQITLDIAGDDTVWQIVGVAKEVAPPTAPALVYVNNAYFERLTDRVGRTSSMRIVATEHDGAAQQRVANAVQSHFESRNIGIRLLRTLDDERAQASEAFLLITTILGAMAVLIGVVGGLGLMGTMSINVLERTREIGVMRSIGASNGAIRQIVIVEGVLVGIFSWLIALIITQPMSRILCAQIGNLLIRSPLNYSYSLEGTLLWLAVVVVISALASFLPAHNASRVTVREVLSYA